MGNKDQLEEKAAKYFDSAATTPLDPRVLEKMLPFLQEEFGNAHSVHHLGLSAANAVEEARAHISKLIGADDPAQIFFTSGATESNNWLVNAFQSGWVSPFEHPSLLRPAERAGWGVLPPDLESSAEFPEVASLMAVNNETGDIWNIRESGIRANLLHSDITQAVGKIPLTVDGLDFASMSSHKIYGPKGVGAFFCSSSAPDPLLIGGDQESGARAGTLNVAGIVGFGEAARIAEEEWKADAEHAGKLKALVLEGLNRLSGVRLLGGSKTSPFILNLSFDDVEGETLVIEADRAGYSISSGAACSSRSTEPSHVLVAMAYPASVIRGSVRISFNRYNNEQSAAGLVKTLAQSVEKLRTLTMRPALLRNGEQVNVRL